MWLWLEYITVSFGINDSLFFYIYLFGVYVGMPAITCMQEVKGSGVTLLLLFGFWGSNLGLRLGGKCPCRWPRNDFISIIHKPHNSVYVQ